jgi:hypothetical protein
VIPLESSLHTQFSEPCFSSLLQIERGGARLDLAAHQLENLAGYLARAAHLLDFLGRLEYDCQPAYSVRSGQ